jgi:hypothetical protein
VTCLGCGEPIDSPTGIAVHPTCDYSPEMVATEVFTLIEKAIVGQPRSNQRRIGPSEIGVPCDRRIGYKLAGVDPVQDRGAAWKPYVGTSLHEQVGNVMASHELQRFCVEDADTVTQRWLVEERVSVGDINGVEITGSSDLFDRHTGTVWDFKFVTRNKIRETYRPHGPGEQYRVQCHLYGRGFARAGYDVRHVGVIFLTRDGEFTDRHVWHEPYDEQVAIDALARATSIAVALEALGPDFTLSTLPTANAYCNFCPWHSSRATDLGRACPGHEPQGDPAAQPLSALLTN